MKLNSIFFKALSLSLAIVMCLPIFVACTNDTDDGKDDEEKADPNLFDISDFEIVRAESASGDVIEQTVALKKAIESKIGPSLKVSIDEDKKTSGKEILIGNTDRDTTATALSTLKEKTEGKTEADTYIIGITKSAIVIAGTSDLATARAIKVFIEKYVDISPKGNGIIISEGKVIMGEYNTENIIYASNGLELDIEVLSNIYEIPKGGMDFDTFEKRLIVTSAHYPSITELKYQKNPEDNGKLVSIFALGGTGDTAACVMISDDGGKTWKNIARPTEKFDTSLNEGSMAHIYELPAQVGDMPAGTLLYSANSVNYSRKSMLSVWRSFDCGKTWDQYVCIDQAGGLKEGIWEPFMVYCEEDQYLYCFYSDDSDPDHDQKISYKRSKDGVKWEGEGGKISTNGVGNDVEPVDVVAVDSFKFRPGMPVITKMGNGEYLMVFELFGDDTTPWKGCPIFYKTTKNLSDWGDPNDYGKMIVANGNFTGASAPACLWTPYGGECGTLMVTTKSSTNNSKLFLSFDYGKTWETVRDPLGSPTIATSGDRIGYSSGLWLSDDMRTVYYACAMSVDGERQKIGFARIKLY